MRNTKAKMPRLTAGAPGRKPKLGTLKATVKRNHAEKKWDDLVSAAVGRLDQGDYDGFWNGIDDLNAYAVLTRDGG